MFAWIRDSRILLQLDQVLYPNIHVYPNIPFTPISSWKSKLFIPFNPMSSWILGGFIPFIPIPRWKSGFIPFIPNIQLKIGMFYSPYPNIQMKIRLYSLYPNIQLEIGMFGSLNPNTQRKIRVYSLYPNIHPSWSWTIPGMRVKVGKDLRDHWVQLQISLRGTLASQWLLRNFFFTWMWMNNPVTPRREPPALSTFPISMERYKNNSMEKLCGQGWPRLSGVINTMNKLSPRALIN